MTTLPTSKSEGCIFTNNLYISIDMTGTHEKEVLNGFCKTPNDRVEYVHDIFLQKSYNSKKRQNHKLSAFNEDDAENDEIEDGIILTFINNRRR